MGIKIIPKGLKGFYRILQHFLEKSNYLFANFLFANCCLLIVCLSNANCNNIFCMEVKYSEMMGYDGHDNKMRKI